jgi:outer membrane receptor protein involved in Fe transport
MDNGMRVSQGQMKTDAVNTTLGLNGPIYEVFFRRWSADNRIVTPMTTIKNHMIPGVRQYSGSVFRRPSTGSLTYWARAGLTFFTLEDAARASFYEPVHGEQTTDRTFVTGALGAAIQRQLNTDLSASVAADVAAEPPNAQSLYIAVQRPGTKAWRSGNPGLKASVRASLRGVVAGYGATLEASAGHVWDYINVAGTTAGGRNYWTFENVDAVLLSVGLKGNWRYLQLAAGYTWANRDPGNRPLAEVPPLYLTYTLRSPRVGKGWAYWRHAYNDAQTRVDEALLEQPTESWNRFDAGIVYDIHPVRLSLEVENVFDELYTQHMSYLRSAFATGVRVYEPGRVIRFNVTLAATGLQ